MILIRHVATDMAGRFCGQSDPAINALGEAQLDALIDALQSWKIAELYASDLRRSRQTAERIVGAFNVPLTLRPALREINFGDWEGLSWQEIERCDGESASKWKESYPYGTVPGGEEYTHFSARVISELQLLADRAQKHHIGVVTHAGVMREILMHRCGVATELAWQWTGNYGAFAVMSDQGQVIFSSVANGGENEYCNQTWR